MSSGLGCAGARNGLQSGNAALRERQRREIGIGSRLIPISHRKVVIGAVIGVAVLDSVLEIFGERDRIIGVPAVQAIPASRALRTYDERRPIVEMRERDGALAAPGVPCAVEVILRPGARDDGLALVVHEHHFIAFAHPVILILQNAQGHSHQVPASARFGKDVVVLDRPPSLLTSATDLWSRWT